MNLQILENIRMLKRRLLPNDRMILFGSRARGDARPDSDWDLLILLGKDRVTYEDGSAYAYPFAEMGWSYGAYLSVKVYAEKQWEKGRMFPFYKNVEKDGIEIR